MRCKILYQRDYLNLLIKYGLEAPSDESEEDDAAPAEPEPGTGTLGSVLAG